ncbi:tripartite tricarboxylate transporter substrate binding protein [Pigmentiphaga soli]|uniref:Tripartite tricarboxylate transporter substrate binding protein n=1 Tax=Pigmentiphaga soli TaxID=1007095 RepID=A0ABP8HJE1_9BURK
MQRPLLLSCLLAAACAAAAPAATAQAWPDRPIRIILGFAPGGQVDSSARIAAKILNDALGQPVTVENRAGAGGMIASTFVARSAPDGYTLLVNATSDIINPIVTKNAGYSIEKDFAPIGLIASSPNVLVVHPSIPAKSVADVVDYARTHPVSYGSAGVNTVSHLAGALLSAMSGVPMTHVAYKGTGAAQVDLLSGRIAMMFDGTMTALPNAKLGKVRAIAVTSLERCTCAPELPTVAESGYPGYSLLPIFGLMAPAGTPPAVVGRISNVLQAALKTPAVREQIAAIGAEPGRMGPDEYRRYLQTETERWTKLAAQGLLRSE